LVTGVLIIRAATSMLAVSFDLIHYLSHFNSLLKPSLSS
jgi:hypothetical protein